jgi:type I restriction-modification system DNA methylase subunit
MPIFLNSVLKTYNQDEALIAQRWAKFQNFLAKVEFVKSVKEEKYQDGFLHDIFEECLGYTLDNTNPQEFNLEREKKNETDSKKADGVIYVYGEVIGIVELKDQKSKNLDAIEAQAFNYHNSHSNSKYIIISNFNELRFYIDKKTAYEKFDLFYLTYDEFKKLHLLLSYESIKEGLPLKLKEKSANFELQISKELYKDFSLFRTHLFENIVKNNSLDKSTLLRLTQKLCDRIIFMLFAEDRGLLRHNTIKEIREEFKAQKFTSYTLYDIYKFYFNAINEGNKKLGIPKYNGGLFAKDELLDTLIIDDEYLDMKAQKLSDYDFMSDVGVNILGHIFEQSLTDLEELQANIEHTDFDKKKSKRKKDGVFYTPEYITRYIVDNTLGRLCHEKKEELQIGGETLIPSNPKKLKKAEQTHKQNILTYREWLTNLKILDPACGSGAFLNQALEFLIKEHTLVRDMLLPFEDLTLGYEIEKEILEHNLYGVDINEDAVEIAKLSLWLRTAHKGRELTKLADKIVCANSLLEMPFDEGSFDVVIGNPPYVRQEMIDNDIKEKYMQMYPHVATSTADLYVYFYELSMKCLSENGLLGFITPNKWMERKYGMNLRSYLKDFNIQTIINYGELNIFDDASTEPAIIIIKNQKKSDDIAYLMVKSLEEAQSFDYRTSLYKKSDLSSEIWKFTNPLVSSILNKFKNVNTTLKEYTNGGVYYGIKTSLNEAFIIDKTKYLEIIAQDKASEKLLKKMVEGDDFGKWHLNHSGRYMVATGYDLEIENDYKGIYNYLEQYRDKLIKRQDKGKNYWNLRACDYYDKLEQPKLIYYHTALNHGFYFDTEGYYISANCYFIANADKYLQCVLNSKLFHFVKKYLFPSFGDSEKGGRVRLDANKMNILPIQKIEESQKEFYIQKADKMLSLNKQLQETKQNFTNELGLEKLTKKLQNFEELEFEEFIKEYAKAKKLKFADKLQERNFKQEWQAIFKNDKALTCKLKAEIAKTDKEIDEMVYKLYGLSDDEIKIVENS